MNKRSIPKIKEKLQKIEKYISETQIQIEYIQSMQTTYNGKDWESVLESVNDAENEVILSLWKVMKMSESIINKIDPESLRELKK